MTIFDLVFLGLVFVSIVALAAAAVAALRGQRARAAAILKVYGAGFAAYMAVVVVTSLFLPRRIASLGEPLCSDDWCLTVERIERASDVYRVGLKIESTAKRVTQREYGVSIYLADVEGRQFGVQPSTSDVPFDVPIRPQEAIETTRLFEMPPGLRPVGLVIRHGSGFPIGWFIIGYETWFRKPTIVRLPAA